MLSETHSCTRKSSIEGADYIRENGCDGLIERMGITRFHHISVTICGLGNAADAVILTSLGFLLSEVEQVFPHSHISQGFASAVTFLGMLFGGISTGILGDRYGRKPTLIGSLCVAAFFQALCAVANSWITLSIILFCAGIGVGGSMPVVFTLYAEYLPVYRRGWYLSIVAWFWMLGGIYASGLAWIMLGISSTLSWKVYTIFCAIPATAGVLLTSLVLPESPRHSFIKKRYQKSFASLISIARIGHVDLDFTIPANFESNSESISATDVVIDPRYTDDDDGLNVPLSMQTKENYEPLSIDETPEHTQSTRWSMNDTERHRSQLSDTSIHATAHAIHSKKSTSSKTNSGQAEDVSLLAQHEDDSYHATHFTDNTPQERQTSNFRNFMHVIHDLLSPELRRTTIALTITWFAVSFGWYGLSTWIPILFKASKFETDAYFDAFLVAAACLPGNIVSSIFMDRLGRKLLLTYTMGISAVIAVIFAFAQSAWQAILAACLLNAVSIGGWNALDCLSTEIFPAAHRTTAVGLLTAFGRTGSMLGQIAFGALIDVSTTAVLILAASMLLLGSVSSALLKGDMAGKPMSYDLNRRGTR